MINRVKDYMTDNQETGEDDEPQYVVVLTRLLPHGVQDTMTLLLDANESIGLAYEWAKEHCQGGVWLVRLEITEVMR